MKATYGNSYQLAKMNSYYIFATSLNNSAYSAVEIITITNTGDISKRQIVSNGITISVDSKYKLTTSISCYITVWKIA